jgi:hypothetical protein
MPREITSGELINLRKNERRSKLFLAFHPYTTVFSCRVNQTFADYDDVTQVTYDGGSGTYTDIKPDMTVWVGSSAGAYDLGLARIRKAASATVLYLGRGSEVQWADNLYITVVDDFDLWAKHWLVQSDVVYMDQDITYSDQNADKNPVAVLGPDAVVELSGASVTHQRDASDSWVLGSTISGYAWAVSGSGASVADETTATPTFTFTEAGVKRISLVLTATNAKTTTVYRYVHVFSAATLPGNEFAVSRIAGDRDSGGWAFQVTMYGDANLSSVRDRAKVILFAQDWYDATKVSIGELAGFENIVCWGWIDGQSITPNPESGGTVVFTVRGPAFWMQELASFPGGLKSTSSAPTSWLYAQSLTVDVALWHLLYWRSTVMSIMDVGLTGDARTASALTANSDGFWEQIVEISGKILASPAVNRLGKLYIEIDPQLVPVADRSGIPVVMDITKVDWSSVAIERVTRTAINRMETSAVSSGGLPLFSRSVGKIVTRFGRGGSAKDNLLVSDQTELNTLTGLLFAKEVNQFPNVDIDLAQNNRMIDIAGQQYLTISLVATDTPRGVVWTDKKLIPQRVELVYDGDNGVISTNLECEAETSGNPGVTVIIPPIPVIGTEGIEIPPFSGWWPAIIPIGTLTPPYVPPVIPPEVNECPTDAPANGPYDLYINGEISGTTYVSRCGTLRCICRTEDHDNKTTYQLQGTFQKLVGETWVDTLDDGFYEVEAKNSAGTVIAIGTHDPVTNPNVRTGVLNAVAAAEIYSICVSVNDTIILRPDNVTLNHIDTAAFSGNETFDWQLYGSGIQARALDVYCTGSTIWTGGDRSMHVGIQVYKPDGSAYWDSGDRFKILSQIWYYNEWVSGGGAGLYNNYMLFSQFRGSLAGETTIWQENFSPARYVNGGYQYYSGLHSDIFTIPVSANQIANFRSKMDVQVSGEMTSYKTAFAEILLRIWQMSPDSYRIGLNQAVLWNVCPPET